MNLRKTSLLSVLALILPVPFVASAQSTATPRVDRRQAQQEQRIQEGVQSGSLTTNEAARLEKGQDHVQKVEDKVKADGVVTGKERVRLTHAENKQSARIYRQEHDPQHDFDHDGKIDRPLAKRR
jgi:hypothetical protein